jgi:hypothetical protein
MKGSQSIAYSCLLRRCAHCMNRVATHSVYSKTGIQSADVRLEHKITRNTSERALEVRHKGVQNSIGLPATGLADKYD